MANTYSQLYNHFVFTVKNRDCLLSPNWRNRLFSYIAGIVENCGHKSLAVNGTSDHVHLFTGMSPIIAPSNLIQVVKRDSTIWINKNKLVRGRFSWQAGFGVFSYSHSQIGNVIQYIANQEIHHKTKTFKEEYLKLLNIFNIKYDNKYLFDWIEI